MQIIYPVPEGTALHRARFQQIFQTAHALAQSGCEVDLLIGRNRTDILREVLPAYGLTEHPNLRIHSLPMLRREEGRFLRVSWDGVFLFAALIKIRSLLRRKPDQFLFTRHLKPASFLLGFRKSLGLPMIFEAHEVFHLTTEKKGKIDRIKEEESKVYPFMDGFVTNTRAVAAKLREIFPISVPMEAIPNGVNPHLFLPPRDRGGKKIIYLGQLYPWKGVGILLEALKYLPAGELHIVGGGREQVETLRQLAIQYGIDARVAFHGQVPPCQVINHLADAAVAVHPLTSKFMDSYFSSPLKIFEYMAARVPIVASDLPSTREVLTDGVNALLTEADNPKALASGIDRLLEDRDLAERLADQAHEDALEYTWDKRAKKLIHFFQRLSYEGGHH